MPGPGLNTMGPTLAKPSQEVNAILTPYDSTTWIHQCNILMTELLLILMTELLLMIMFYVH